MLSAGLALAGTPALWAQANIIALGSPLTFGGTDAPDTFQATTTFGPTKVLVDNGKVQIWQEQQATGSNGEWDVFHIKTVNGGPLAGDINAYWNITMSFTFGAAALFDQVAEQWLVNGQVVGPLQNFSSVCCAKQSSAIFQGWQFHNSGFSAPFPAGPFNNWQQIFAQPYNILAQGGVNPSTANEFQFALHFTLQNSPPIVTGVISASAFGGFPSFSSGSWIEIYGTNLSGGTQNWETTDFNGSNAPTALGGTSVTIGGQAAFVDYISPGQVNVQVPGGVAAGTQQLILTTGKQSSAPFNVNVVASEPGLLAPASFKLGGTQYAVALFSDNTTYVLPPGAIAGVTSRRAKPGDTITLYGIGFGAVTPTVDPGVIASGLTPLSTPPSISIGGMPVATPLPYAGLAPNLVGLYQFNVVVPGVAPGDAVPVTFTLNGTPGTQTLALPIGQ